MIFLISVPSFPNRHSRSFRMAPNDRIADEDDDAGDGESNRVHDLMRVQGVTVEGQIVALARSAVVAEDAGTREKLNAYTPLQC